MFFKHYTEIKSKLSEQKWLGTVAFYDNQDFTDRMVLPAVLYEPQSAALQTRQDGAKQGEYTFDLIVCERAISPADNLQDDDFILAELDTRIDELKGELERWSGERFSNLELIEEKRSFDVPELWCWRLTYRCTLYDESTMRKGLTLAGLRHEQDVSTKG